MTEREMFINLSLLCGKPHQKIYSETNEELFLFCASKIKNYKEENYIKSINPLLLSFLTKRTICEAIN